MASLIAALCAKDQSVVKRFLLLIEPFTYSLIFEVCALVSFSFGFSHRRRPSNGSAENSSQHETVTNGWHHHQLVHETVTVHSHSNVEPSIEPLNHQVEPLNRSTEPLNSSVEPSVEPKPSIEPLNSSVEPLNRSTNEQSEPSNGSVDKPSEPAPSNHQIEPTSQRRTFSKDEALAALLTDLALGRGFGSQDKLAERFNRPKSTISVWLKDWTKQGLIPERSVRGRCKELKVE
jgi:hypothetical protein